MRPILLLLAAVLSGHSMTAQKVIDITNTDAAAVGQGLPMATIGSEPFAVAKFVRVTSGTPYLDEKWMGGTIVLASGRVCKGLSIRLNLVDNSVIYKEADGVEKIASSPMRFIILSDSANGASYRFIHGSQLNLTDKLLQRTWFQVLLNDSVSLCKQIRKTINDLQTYGSATTEQVVDTHVFYFVHIRDSFVPVRKWDDLQVLFKDKKDQIVQYCHVNHLKGKSEADYVALVKYYNSQLAGETLLR